MNEKDIKTIKLAWKSVFGETPEVRQEEDELIINTYLTIHPHKFDVEFKSILGTETRTVDGYMASEWIDIPQTYWEPPDVDERELGEFETLEGAIKAIIQSETENRLNGMFETIQMAEIYGE